MVGLEGVKKEGAEEGEEKGGGGVCVGTSVSELCFRQRCTQRRTEG